MCMRIAIRTRHNLANNNVNIFLNAFDFLAAYSFMMKRKIVLKIFFTLITSRLQYFLNKLGQISVFITHCRKTRENSYQ